MPLGAFKAALMGTAGVSAGADVVLLSTQTATSDASISFTSGIDSTYGEYIFRFYTLNPESSGAFQFQVNATDGADYNDSAITSTHIQIYHKEDDSGTALSYRTAGDQAQGTAFQELQPTCGSGADEAAVGELHLFNPSSTTYVKHWYCQLNSYTGTYMQSSLTAGYINDTTAIDDIQFKFASGDFDGKIKMWGVK